MHMNRKSITKTVKSKMCLFVIWKYKSRPDSGAKSNQVCLIIITRLIHPWSSVSLHLCGTWPLASFSTFAPPCSEDERSFQVEPPPHDALRHRKTPPASGSSWFPRRTIELSRHLRRIAACRRCRSLVWKGESPGAKQRSNWPHLYLFFVIITFLTFLTHLDSSPSCSLYKSRPARTEASFGWTPETGTVMVGGGLEQTLS